MHQPKDAMKPPRYSHLLVGLLSLLALGAHAQTVVTDAWVRGTVPQQKATGLFAKISSASGARLVSASSVVAGAVEIHEMSMAGNVMKMRAVPDGLELPAGKAVELKPGGYHLMLLDLKQTLQAGDVVPVTLVIESAGKQRETVAVQATVRALGSAPAGDHKH